jgi:hypothetical protein
MMESGQYASVGELALAEKINQSYLCRILRLALLAPNIVESILNGRAHEITMERLMRPFPIVWEQQGGHSGS